MSHIATEWALKQRGLKPASRIVLFCLADRHNPDLGCFPSHKRLAEDAEMSDRSVRDHLAILEAKGLIRRETGGRKAGEFASTRYLLAFEEGFEPAPDRRQDLPSAESASGKKTQPPSAEFAANRRQDLPTNLVRGTKGKRTGKKSARAARLPPDWQLPRTWGQWAVEEGLDELSTRREAEKFRDYWHAKGGKDAAKLDWQATWRNWVRRVLEERPGGKPAAASQQAPDIDALMAQVMGGKK